MGRRVAPMLLLHSDDAGDAWRNKEKAGGEGQDDFGFDAEWHLDVPDHVYRREDDDKLQDVRGTCCRDPLGDLAWSVHAVCVAPDDSPC